MTMKTPKTQLPSESPVRCIRLVGRCVEVGDDDEGQPRLIIHTTREQLMNFGRNLAFVDVEVTLHSPNNQAHRQPPRMTTADTMTPVLPATVEPESGEAVGCSALFSELAEKQRADQLGINCRWLIDKVDRIHRALCPDQCGTWQQRAEQAVEAAQAISKVRCNHRWSPIHGHCVHCGIENPLKL
jgi:hypothetical protein